jgi:hypothetical protein
MTSSRRVSTPSSRLATEGFRAAAGFFLGAAACFLRGAALAPLAEGCRLTDFLIAFFAIYASLFHCS